MRKLIGLGLWWLIALGCGSYSEGWGKFVFAGLGVTLLIMSFSGVLKSLRDYFRNPVVRVSASVSMATGLYGISFGALSIAAGLNLWQTVALSSLMFTGGSQFAFISAISGGGGVIGAINAATLLGVRNAIYGMQNNLRIGAKSWKKLAAIHFSIDEPTAVSSGQENLRQARLGFWLTGIGVYSLWNLFTIIGALIGEQLGDPKVWGLDGAATAAFLGLLWPRLKEREPVTIAVVCAAVTIIAVPFVPSGIPIMIAAGAAVLFAMLTPNREVLICERAESSIQYEAHLKSGGDEAQASTDKANFADEYSEPVAARMGQQAKPGTSFTKRSPRELNDSR